eukprot:TRINITY_DN2299_c4_g1_i1.p1 TRINITY_DN2299_c4_g1~~TRINITY_DN2299_c4_g1_i1.p1  ORF type:complete len:507 (+),score=182.57 TRINITY_DN2299_c4_g1_i1:81-1523(+)
MAAKIAEMTQINAEWREKLKQVAGEDVTYSAVTFVQSFKQIPLSAWVESQTGDWEDEAKEKRKKVKVLDLNRLCHQAYTKVFNLQRSAKKYDVAVEEPQAWKTLLEHGWDDMAALKSLGVNPSGPLLKEVDFCDRECAKAPLLNEDRGYLRRMGDKIFQVTADYVGILEGLGEVDRRPAKIVPITKRDGELERVIIQDAIRTFFAEDHRLRLEEFINGALVEFGDYSQGMVHVAAILMLTLPEDDVMLILRKINSEYIVGHWAHEATGYGINAFVFGHVAKPLHADILSHFETMLLSPEMYCRKWFSQLFLHALDLEHWYVFFRNFLQHGFPYLIACGLSTFTVLKDRLLRAGDVGTAMRLLALDSKSGVSARDGRKIVDDAVELVGDVRTALGTEEELKALRQQMFDVHLKKRMEEAEAAKKAAEADQDKVETCPFSGKSCEKVVKWALMKKGDELDDELICADCASCARQKGYGLDAW